MALQLPQDADKAKRSRDMSGHDETMAPGSEPATTAPDETFWSKRYASRGLAPAGE